MRFQNRLITREHHIVLLCFELFAIVRMWKRVKQILEQCTPDKTPCVQTSWNNWHSAPFWIVGIVRIMMIPLRPAPWPGCTTVDLLQLCIPCMHYLFKHFVCPCKQVTIKYTIVINFPNIYTYIYNIKALNHPPRVSPHKHGAIFLGGICNNHVDDFRRPSAQWWLITCSPRVWKGLGILLVRVETWFKYNTL